MLLVTFFPLAKQERLLRRRTPRNSPANVEASQSATVSSTSSSPECNASAPKRVSYLCSLLRLPPMSTSSPPDHGIFEA